MPILFDTHTATAENTTNWAIPPIGERMSVFRENTRLSPPIEGADGENTSQPVTPLILPERNEFAESRNARSHEPLRNPCPNRTQKLPRRISGLCEKRVGRFCCRLCFT